MKDILGISFRDPDGWGCILNYGSFEGEEEMKYSLNEMICGETFMTISRQEF